MTTALQPIELAQRAAEWRNVMVIYEVWRACPEGWRRQWFTESWNELFRETALYMDCLPWSRVKP